MPSGPYRKQSPRSSELLGVSFQLQRLFASCCLRQYSHLQNLRFARSSRSTRPWRAGFCRNCPPFSHIYVSPAESCSADSHLRVQQPISLVGSLPRKNPANPLCANACAFPAAEERGNGSSGVVATNNFRGGG